MIPIIDNSENINKTNFIIYLLRNTINKKIYIGQSKDLKKRLLHHKNSKNNQLIVKSINKYGFDNFICEILFYCQNLDELNIKEKEYIKKYNSTNLLLGYNIKEGGMNTPHSQSTREKIRLSNINKTISKETIEKIRESTTGDKNHFYGKKHTDETREKMKIGSKNKKPTTEQTREKMRLSQTGRKHPEEVKNKMKQPRLNRRKNTPIILLNLNKEIINEFENYKLCADYLNITIRTVQYGIQNKSIILKSYYVYKKYNEFTKISILDIEYNIIEEFNNTQICAEYLGITKRSVEYAIREKILAIKKFYIIKNVELFPTVII